MLPKICEFIKLINFLPHWVWLSTILRIIEYILNINEKEYSEVIKKILLNHVT